MLFCVLSCACSRCVVLICNVLCDLRLRLIDLCCFVVCSNGVWCLILLSRVCWLALGSLSCVLVVFWCLILMCAVLCCVVLCCCVHWRVVLCCLVLDSVVCLYCVVLVCVVGAGLNMFSIVFCVVVLCCVVLC